MDVELEAVFSIAICRQSGHSGDKWQSKTLFLTIFDLRSSIVLKYSIAVYPVWLPTWVGKRVWPRRDNNYIVGRPMPNDIVDDNHF